jgi:hypothetical protein
MKYVLYPIVTFACLCLIKYWYEIYITGNYYQNATLFLAVLGGIIPLAIIYIAYLLIRYIKNS